MDNSKEENRKLRTITSRLLQAIKIYSDRYKTEDMLIDDSPIDRVTFYRIKGGFWEGRMFMKTKRKLDRWFREELGI